MILKRKLLVSAAVMSIVCVAGSFIGIKDVQADTSAKAQQGVVLKTSELKVNKVIVSPKPSSNTSNTSSSGRNRNNTSSNEQNVSRSVNKSSNEVINYAYNFLGKPYVFGATGPNAFDCSGFTSYVYKHFGVTIPRTSQSQSGAGTAVSRSNLAAGDLVFFNTYTSRGHVGIYIGGGDFIHAASSGCVKVSSLSEGYYNSRYAGARRVF